MMEFRGIEKDKLEIDAVYVGVYNSPILLTEFKRIRWNFFRASAWVPPQFKFTSLNLVEFFLS